MGVHGRSALDGPTTDRGTRRRASAGAVLTSTQRRPARVLGRLRAWPALAVLVGWTLFLWGSRLRNVLGDDELSDAGVAWRVAVVVVFVALATLATTGRAISVLVWWTVGFWIVRGGGIILDDHDLGFTVIHTILMAVSIGVAMWVWLTRSR